MACERSLDALSDVAAGAEATRELEEHLAGCAACRADLSGLRQALARMDGELAKILEQEPTPALLPRIREAVESEASNRIAWRWGSAGWLAAATTVALGVALVAILAGRPDPPTGRRLAETAVTPPAAERPSVPEHPGVGGSPPAAVPSPETPGLAADAQPRHLAPASRAEAGAPAITPHRAKVPRAEVLVPADEAVALLRLAGVLAEGRVDARELIVVSSASSALLPELAPLDIRPLEIAPLEPSGSSGP